MNERKKLCEGQDFLGRMQAVICNRQEFCHNLSAFLSAARSVLQYACAEAKQTTGGQAWYEGRMSSDPILGWFRDKRDFNIHEAPVEPAAKATLEINETVSSGESFLVVLRDKDGNVVETRGTATPPPKVAAPTSTSSIRFTYFFIDWGGPDADVISLCAKYLSVLESIVEDGVAKGFISG